ncbi:MAG: DNA polymerase/3'-5' exonuclease PolX [Candidatus Omnitrophica bacterium]|nr:DNA polymerase/3'-5' exonuclease PolX [Candidatus Omnitrophota bacterium]MCG2705827.1 DNA polymerase/3'-5' exonuclease PolX [Candidatus Omnitrophota bacterium]
MHNKQIADILRNIADILEIQGDNPFRIRAYRKAADIVGNLTEDISVIAAKNGLTELPGIGEDLASKIKEFLETGKISFYEKLLRKISPVVLEMLNIPGVGPKTAKVLYDNLNIKSLKDLEAKAKANLISGLPGIKDKTEENILKGLEFLKKDRGRMLVDTAFTTAEYMISGLRGLAEVIKISPAGSLRRMKETIRDIDILVTSKKPQRIMEAFTGLPNVANVVARGPTKSSVMTKDNVQVDLRVVPPESYGAALMYFTGSKEHNVELRKIAVRRGLKINEYGVFNVKNNKRIAGSAEPEIYAIFKMGYIEPELRENTGEIQSALKGNLPKLVTMDDIKGDFHIHTEASDGVLTIAEIAKTARQKKYNYVVITDHSASLKIAGGLSEKELLRQRKKLDAFNKKTKGIKLLLGSEVDILDNGSMDYRDDVLKELDFVIAAIHTGFQQSKEKLTTRIVKAMHNRYVNMVAHPSGRLIGERAAYELDYDKIFAAAKDTGTAIEINSCPQRLDITDVNCKRAKEMGVKMAIATDSHAPGQMDNMIYGVSVARRGWLEKRDVINSLSSKELSSFVKKKRR